MERFRLLASLSPMKSVSRIYPRKENWKNVYCGNPHWTAPGLDLIAGGPTTFDELSQGATGKAEEPNLIEGHAYENVADRSRRPPKGSKDKGKKEGRRKDFHFEIKKSSKSNEPFLLYIWAMICWNDRSLTTKCSPKMINGSVVIAGRK